MKKILFLAANPSETTRLQLDHEYREISNSLSYAKNRNEFDLHALWAPRSADVRRALLKHRPNIIHFAGHAVHKEGLIFENDTGQAQLVRSETLAGLFQMFSSCIDCIILNACYTESQAKLIAQHIDFVVGMKNSANDQNSIEFSVAFYDALGNGESYEFAFNLAKNAVQWLDTCNDSGPFMITRRNTTQSVITTSFHSWDVGSLRIEAETIDTKQVITEISARELIELVHANSHDATFTYTLVQQYLEMKNAQSSTISLGYRSNRSIVAQCFGDIGIIATNKQYKEAGLVLFLNLLNNEVILLDEVFPQGISGIKVIENVGVSPHKLFNVKYITITGTGTFGESVRIYALCPVEGHQVAIALDKPYREVNSGWRAFESDFVEFTQRHDFITRNGNLELHATGIVYTNATRTQFRKLPEEIFVWNQEELRFSQTSGRIVKDKKMMTSIYSDLANSIGNWFDKASIEEINQDVEYTSEEW